MNDIASTLYTVMFLLSVVATFTWLGISLVIKIAPRASMMMVIANILLAIGLWLTLNRTSTPSYWYWSIADILILLSILGVQYNIKLLHGAKTHRVEGWTLTFAIVTTFLIIGPDPANKVAMGVAFNLIAAYVMSRLVVNIMILPLERSNTAKRIGMAWPFAVFAVIEYAGLVRFWITGTVDYPNPERNIDLWSYVFLVLVLNSQTVAITLAWMMGRLNSLAERCPLTGLLNRRVFMTTLAQEQARYKRSGKRFSILMIDLDNFKSINDTYGHIKGDEALIHVANVLSRTLREVDILARYGGEEFVVLLPDTDSEEAKEVAERMRQEIESNRFYNGQSQIVLTVSIGLASVNQIDADRLIDKADQALYKAKNRGRNQIVQALPDD